MPQTIWSTTAPGQGGCESPRCPKEGGREGRGSLAVLQFHVGREREEGGKDDMTFRMPIQLVAGLRSPSFFFLRVSKKKAAVASGENGAREVAVWE